jgi:hypothetical protein
LSPFAKVEDPPTGGGKQILLIIKSVQKSDTAIAPEKETKRLKK